ncbi:dynamin family protein [Bacteroides oleiciplenus]|uniref:Dynamin N-terminal domain-containing protein n=1 Tax=Bacteroides oleiciplenus YIT 12058 TaxID=742727 RepID=K9E1L4_9BACE|nr:dynamin family protein [Bacteroides oleiciplenus]EKU89561.1 hypothetical protein HMPREF9447_02999 [Bacteroides oleiciplenus YIT 12058]
MDLLSTLNTLHTIISDSLLPEINKDSYLNRLRKIEQRSKDSNIYVGIVGEFSSGKSTLINSLIGADYFVTNSLQGTTTTITAIKYAETADLELKYKNGKSLRYSNNKLSLIEKYLPEVYKKLSIGEKIKLKVVGLLGGNKKDELLLRIFDVVTTSDDASEDLDEAVVYHPSDFLKNGIVILDTPGTDSLNPNHQTITERAISEKCDLAMVIIPSNTPFSQTLSGFIEDNLLPCIDKCFFLITKVELLRKDVERRSLIKWVNSRLDAFFGIENPKTILAPTLLSLEERGLIERTGMLEHLSSEDRFMLSSEFDSDTKRMFNEILAGKDDAIRGTLNRFIKSLNANLMKEISKKQIQLETDLATLKRLQTIPLNQFMANFFKKEDADENFSFTEARLQNLWYKKQMDFERYVCNKIDQADSKNEAQGVMDEGSTISYGQSCFQDCYNAFSSELNGLISFHENNFDSFRNLFSSTFSITALDFTFKLKNKPSWQREYKSNFSKWNLTTAPLFRVFKKLQTIKQEMKDEVRRQLEINIEKMQSYYMQKITEANTNLNEQMEKIKPLFASKYNHIINKKIAEEQQKEQLLRSQIAQLQQSLKTLESIIH